jgi:hypothetical protein
MTVYVDNVEHRFGRMKMCHLWADSVEELHEFAGRLDPRLRRWFQCPPKASWEHYDISKGYRARAIAMGAVLMDKYAPAEHAARIAGRQEVVDRIRRVREKFGMRNDGRVNHETLKRTKQGDAK